MSAVVDSLGVIIAHRDSLVAHLIAHPPLIHMVSDDTVRVALAEKATRFWGVSVKDVVDWIVALLSLLATAGLALLGWRAAERSSVKIQERQWDAEKAQRKERLLRRVRSALETAEFAARASLRKDHTHPINPETMNGIILDWARFDRVADDLGLLGDTGLEDRIDAVLGFARLAAEKVVEDERRFREDRDKLGKVTPEGIELHDSVLQRIYSKRRELLGLLGKVELSVKAVRTEVMGRWSVATGYEPREVPEAGGSTAADESVSQR